MKPSVCFLSCRTVKTERSSHHLTALPFLKVEMKQLRGGYAKASFLEMLLPLLFLC